MSQSIEHVLLLSNSGKVGGGNRSLLLLQHGLESRGIETQVIVPADGPMADACRDECVCFRIHSAKQPSWKRPDLIWREYRDWRRLIKWSSPQVIHANDIMTARSIALAAKQLGIPIVCHIRFAPGKEVTEWAFRGLPKPAAFIFNSHAMLEECGTCFRKACPQSDQVVIHNAVDLNRFAPRSKQSVGRRVGILANLIPVKGHRDFLEMAKLLSDRGNQAEYWLIGDDIHETGYRAELEGITTDLGLDEAVHFLGHRTDIPNLLRELDVLVCASHVEPFGRCLIEGMACETPVVATRVGGIPEVVEDGVTGIMVSPHRPHELADAVETLLQNAALAREMGKSGRKRAKLQFATDAHVEATLKVYDSVLGKNHLHESETMNVSDVTVSDV